MVQLLMPFSYHSSKCVRESEFVAARSCPTRATFCDRCPNLNGPQRTPHFCWPCAPLIFATHAPRVTSSQNARSSASVPLTPDFRLTSPSPIIGTPVHYLVSQSLAPPSNGALPQLIFCQRFIHASITPHFVTIELSKIRFII